MSKASEHAHQTTLVKWFRRDHPNMTIFSIPNGGNREPSEAAKLVREGLLKGVPDLFIPELKMFIEMKNSKGKLSKHQKYFIDRMVKCGYTCEVCYSYLEAKKAIISGIHLLKT